MQAKKLEESEDSEGSPCANSNANEDTKSEDDNSREGSTNFDSIIDVSGKNFDFPVFQGLENAREVLYMYKNVFNLIPSAVGAVKELKSLKFFGNELNLFPLDFNDFLDLESLQLKVPEAPGLGGLDLGKLKALKELELSRVPLRPSAFPLLSELAGLKYLTKLSVCHFSIRYLPPEIGRLNNLEYLDLSFNKMRNLPSEITYLNSLISLKVANNKLVELPSGLCSLQNLENLDLSSNRLTSLGCLELGSMHNLRRLNLQFNKLLSCCQIPSWICCNLEGNGKDISNDEFISASAEMDVLESVVEGIHERAPGGSSAAPVSYSSGSSPSNRSFAGRKSKGWKRRYSLQQRARQERLNSRRKGQNHAAVHNASEKCIACAPSSIVDNSFAQGSTTILAPQFDDKEFLSGAVESENSTISTAEDDITLRNNKGDGKCSCGHVEPLGGTKKTGGGCSTCNESLSSQEAISSEDQCLLPEICSSVLKSKRHSDRVLDNPKPSKYRRPTGDHSVMSSKYSRASFCSIEDYLPDGFYDAGRDRPFMPLSLYEQNLHLDSREVILVDRTRDERLDAVVHCAKALVSHFLKINGGSIRESRPRATNALQIVSLLAFFVSDHFGGSDKSGVIQRTRKAVSGSNYTKPFVCTCSTGNEQIRKKPMKESPDGAEDIVLLDLCERSIQSIKARRNSVVVPLGSLQFGVCRHRALLMKYLCDRLDPPIPCELVRGFLDFSPHAWNVIAIRRGQSWVRMIVDACHPHDIREETDPEYFSRYVPLSWINICNGRDGKSGQWDSFPSLSASDEIERSTLTTLIQCNVGSCIAAAKVRKLEICGTSLDEIRNFELNCLGEARILGSLKHPCIVKYYGHQISSKWAPSSGGNSDLRVLQSAILMEYIKGGSLKCYLEKLARAGDKHVPAMLALFIARDIAYALTELHSKHIIHRDIKSENILINLDEKKDDGSPIVKLGDFDRAVPLRSSLHSCCIAHIGIPPPDICVGTPRWMAPEVLRTMEKRDLYGLEVDIWSFGCLLLELLTLQVPYIGLSETDINNFLKRGERPQLTEELEELTDYNGRDVEALVVAQPQCSTETGGSESESRTLRFLIALYCWCTEKNPADRPTARKLYKLLEKASSVIKSTTLEQ